MSDFVTNNPVNILSLDFDLDVKPVAKAANVAVWDLAELEAAKKNPHENLVRIREHLIHACKPHGREITFELRDVIAGTKRSIRLDALYIPPPQQDSAPDKRIEYKRLLIDSTERFTKILSEYTDAAAKGLDLPISLGQGSEGCHDKILSTQKVEVDSAHKCIMSDARAGSKRPELTATWSSGQKIKFPAAPRTYATHKTKGEIVIEGSFNAADDDRRTVKFRPLKGRGIYTLCFSPKLRDSIVEAQLRRMAVKATVLQTSVALAGASETDTLELIKFHDLAVMGGPQLQPIAA